VSFLAVHLGIRLLRDGKPMSDKGHMRLIASLLFSILTLATLSSAPAAAAKEWLVYVGTYTAGTSTSKGIQALRLNRETGELTGLTLAAETQNPSFLALHPNGRSLYAVNEVGQFDGKPGGGVTSFAIGKGGTLVKINEQSSGGGGPAHISLNKEGTHAFVANYGGGSVSVLPISKDGRLQPSTGFIQHEGSGADPKRQNRPHAHSINVDPSGKFAIAADLGLDKLFVYKFDKVKGTIAPNDPPFASVAPGSGARHFAFAPNGKFGYAINELKSTITAFSWDAAKGTLTEVQTISTLPEGFTGESFTAEVQVHPSGKFVYGSNRGHNSIAVFAVDQKTGKLTAAGHQSTGGSWPRHFGIDPSGAFLLAANQRSDSIVVLRINASTGALAETGMTAQVGQPACVKFIEPK
jgi:6-phosphogluconolactonase